MIKQSICLAAGAAACVALAASRPQVQNPTPKFEEQATPGQLQIMDKAGKPVGDCPLKHTDVKVDIAGYVARVTVTQEFANPGKTPIEAIYTFPLPEDAAVDDMTMVIGKRVGKGTILRREEARHYGDVALPEPPLRPIVIVTSSLGAISREGMCSKASRTRRLARASHHEGESARSPKALDSVAAQRR